MQVMGNIREIFISNVRKEAKRRGIKIKQLADLAGVSQSGLYKIMQKNREPGFDTVEILAEALGVTPESLLVDPLKRTLNRPPSVEEALSILTEFVRQTKMTK